MELNEPAVLEKHAVIYRNKHKRAAVSKNKQPGEFTE